MSFLKWFLLLILFIVITLAYPYIESILPVFL